MAASAAFPPISRSTCSPIDEASGCDVATHPLVQTTDERREVKGSGGGDEDTSAALSVAEECQSAMMGGRSGRFLWYEHASERCGGRQLVVARSCSARFWAPASVRKTGKPA